MLSPLVEFSGLPPAAVLYWSGLFNVSYAATSACCSHCYTVLVSVLAVLLDDIAFRRYPTAGRSRRLLVGTVLENFGFRQLTVWWRVRAFWEFWRGDLSWGAMERRGVGTA